MKTGFKIFMIALIIFSLVLNISVYAALEAPLDSESEIAEISKHSFLRTDVKKSKSLSLKNQPQKSLSYNQSYILSQDNIADIYVDDDSNEYWFDSDDDLFSYGNDALPPAEKKIKDPIDANEAGKIATTHMNEFYPKFENFGFTLDQCSYYEGPKAFYAEFSVKYGKESFIKGPLCRVLIFKDGTVSSSTMLIKDYLNFDSTLLKDLAKETVDQAVEAQIQAAYNTGLAEYTLDYYRLVFQNGKPVVLVSADIGIYSDAADPSSVYYVAQDFYYEIVL